LPSIPAPPYPKAPLTEAVIQVTVAPDATETDLQAVVDRLTKSYPNTARQASFDVEVNSTGGGVTLRQQPHGFRLSTHDQANIALVSPNGVATVCLAPYPGWEALRDRARANWSEWRRVLGGRQLTRIGIRYVNRIDVPVTAGETSPSRYLAFRPLVPEISGKRPLTGYMQQVTLPTESEPWSATITSAVVTPPPLVNHISFLLDIDLFCFNSLPNSEDSLWDFIERARPIKNGIFERCITDESRKLFA
jgi:uncharacterized protein (TIGR04255 family)